jgi:3-polyprenyl-4-hydroxybenzoate decarboxylase
VPRRVRGRVGVAMAPLVLVLAIVGAPGAHLGSKVVVSLPHAASAATVVLTAKARRWMHDRPPLQCVRAGGARIA